MIPLESCALTPEDSMIWQIVGLYHQFKYNTFLESTVDQDRRDAEKMLWREQFLSRAYWIDPSRLPRAWHCAHLYGISEFEAL